MANFLRKIAPLYLFLLTVFLMSGVPAFALELQGLMYDESNPEESIVIIDGEYIKKGDEHQGYVVEDVGPNWVQVYNDETGDMQRLKMDRNEKEMKKKEAEKATEVDDEEEVVAEEKNFFQRLLDKPKQLINYGIELKAIYNLALINNAAVHYYQKMGFFPRHFKQITRAGLLNESFEKGESFKYKFYFDPTTNPDGFGVHADPIDKSSGLKYFFVGVDATIRVSERKPATILSPAHDYPGLKKS